MKNIIYLFAFIALLACHGRKKTTSTTTSTVVAQKTVLPDSVYRLNVSFISIGAGIDRRTKTKYDQYIMDFEQKNKIKLVYESVSWGKEGEVDHCFKLSELNSDQQSTFITEIKEILKSSTTIRLTENTTCRQKRK